MIGGFRRGLFGMWLVVTICWVAVVAAAAYRTVLEPRETAASQQACADERSQIPELGNPFDCFKNPPGEILPIGPSVAKYLSIAMVPPALIFGLGYVVIWVLCSFRRT